MTDPIGPVKPVNALRRLFRRTDATGTALVTQPDPRAGDDAAPNLPAVAVTQLVEQPAAAKAGEAVYAAQVMGQGGQKRGLRGGDETLNRARSTYLETEYSGPADRRIRRGRIAKTEI